MSKVEEYTSPIMEEMLQSISPEEFEKYSKKMLIAARIDDAMIAKGWKKKDLAKAMGKTSSEITKWLYGGHNFTIDTLFDLERVLNFNIFIPFEELQEGMNAFKYAIDPQSYSQTQEDLISMSFNEEHAGYHKA